MTYNPTVLFKALADETRLKILLLIVDQSELCVCELTTALQLSQPKISRHLARLKKDKLLIDRRNGQWVFYSLPLDLPEWVKELLVTTFNTNSSFIADNNSQLAAMGDRPTRQKSCCNT